MLHRLLQSFIQVKTIRRWGNSRLSRMILRCECREECQADGIMCIPFSLDRFGYIDALYRCSKSLQPFKQFKSFNTFWRSWNRRILKARTIVKPAFSRK